MSYDDILSASHLQNTSWIWTTFCSGQVGCSLLLFDLYPFTCRSSHLPSDMEFCADPPAGHSYLQTVQEAALLVAPPAAHLGLICELLPDLLLPFPVCVTSCIYKCSYMLLLSCSSGLSSSFRLGCDGQYTLCSVAYTAKLACRAQM